jgi:hypothetical protein
LKIEKLQSVRKLKAAWANMANMACGVVVWVALAAVAAADVVAAKSATYTVLKDTDTVLPQGEHAICAATKVC